MAASSLDQTGVMQVNGAWATSVRYEAEVLGPKAGTTNLRFMQGRTEIATVTLPLDKMAQLIGERNSAAIARHVASDADKYLATVQGELRGRRLQYGEITLPDQKPKVEENSIGVARVRRARPASAEKEPPAATVGNTQPAASTDRTPGDAKSNRQNPVPTHIASKYLVQDDRYYFDDRTVAFIDAGSRLTAQTHNTAVINDLIEIAKAREWQAVNVTGTRAFRREAWREAHAAGLNVTGYRPSDLERTAADRDPKRREGDKSRGSETEQVNLGATRDPPANHAKTPGSQQSPSRGVMYGTLVDHGVAPYQHDPSKSITYFVTLKDAASAERTHWGVGLGTALRQAQSAPTIGDRVGIERVGSTPVTLVNRAIGADGQARNDEITAKRHQWRIEKEEFLRGDPKAGRSVPPPIAPEPSRIGVSLSTDSVASAGVKGQTRAQQAAAAIRSAETTREELQLKYPELNRAVFQHLASHEQFAAAYVKAGLIRETDRAQVIAQMRERLAGQLERGRPLREPSDKQVSLIIRRSINRVAADIGRPAVETRLPEVSRGAITKPLVREDVQVR